MARRSKLKLLAMNPLRRSNLSLLCVLTFLLINWLLFFRNRHNQTNEIISINNNTVNKKIDLLNVDVRKYLKYQNWKHSGFDNSIRNEDFIKKEIIGYVSNLSMDSFVKRHVEANDEEEIIEDVEELKNLYDNSGRQQSKEYNDMVSCDDLRYNNTLEYKVGDTPLEVDLKAIRRSLLYSESNIAQFFSTSDEKNWSEDEIIEKRWYAFGTAAVWLKDEDCFVAYTRVIYSVKDNREHSYISVVAAQAYDKNWNELHGKRIPYRDFPMPKRIRKELNHLKKLQNTKHCDKHHDKLAYENCISKTNKNTLGIQQKIDDIINKYTISYPTVLDVPFKVRDRWNGPEDPHVILKSDGQGEEPVVIFNMATKHGRKVHAFMPHRKTDPMVEFNIDHVKMKGDEKNWSPFFYPGATESNNNSPGYIHFVYDYSPVEILRCSLFTGHCNFVFQAETLALEKHNSGDLRGGTQYIPLPDILPGVKNKKIWLGFPKSHIERCGCGQRFYRPVLSLMVESDGIYHQELVTPNIDFDEDVLGWNLQDYLCGGYNVLSPSAISNWFVVNQDPRTRKFEDYMTLTFSEADFLSKRVTIKGVLNYILGIYQQKNMSNDFTISKAASIVVSKTAQCVKDGLVGECKRYGILHPEPEKKDDKKKD